jgi:hypothetical protein
MCNLKKTKENDDKEKGKEGSCCQLSEEQLLRESEKVLLLVCLQGLDAGVGHPMVHEARQEGEAV